MADAVGDVTLAQHLRQQWLAGRAMAEQQLWHGDRYRPLLRCQAPAVQATAIAGDQYQEVYRTGDAHASELAARPVDAGLHTDALNGEASALLLGLPRAFDGGRVRGMLRRILADNHHHDGGFIANGSCADGSFPDQWPFCQWQNPWTGTEYFLAAQLIAEGLVEEGLAVVRAVHARMDAAGVRFNHNECGDHYSRALSIYAVHRAWLGLTHDAVRGLLVLAPAGGEIEHHGPFFCAAAWGVVRCSQRPDGFTASITPRQGVLDIQRLRIPKPGTHAVTIDGRPLDAVLAGDDLVLAQPLALGPEHTLSLGPPLPRRV